MKSVMKIFVNFLTMLRLIFSIIIIFLVDKISNLSFLFIIAFLFITDFLDGYLSRKFKVQTKFGAVMDTVADKTLCFALIIPILLVNNYFSLILIGEILIGFLNGISFIKGKKTRVSLCGKVKMWILSITIILGYAYKLGFINYYIALCSCFVTFAFQLYTLINYIIYLDLGENVMEV